MYIPDCMIGVIVAQVPHFVLLIHVQ